MKVALARLDRDRPGYWVPHGHAQQSGVWLVFRDGEMQRELLLDNWTGPHMRALKHGGVPRFMAEPDLCEIPLDVRVLRPEKWMVPDEGLLRECWIYKEIR